MEAPEHQEAITITDELLGLGVGAVKELADVVPEFKRLQWAPVGPALRERLGEDQRGVRLKAVEERWVPVREKPVALADPLDVLSAQTHRQRDRL
jgi:hypothetical protein